MTVDLLLHRANLVTVDERGGYGVVRDGAVAIEGDTIAWVGATRDRPADLDARTVLDAGGRWITPGLVDCHTHLVYAGQRANEFERRLHGASYADIAREGGGIMATVRATRAASRETLVAQSEPRMRALAAEGATTIEIKSGYGLEADTELRMLEVARLLGDRCEVDVRTTLLAAHALPPEYAGRADDYVDLVCETIIPRAAGRGLADAVDAFCETIAFTPEQTRRVFECARGHGLPVKLHADQLSDSGGAALVASFGGLSADHVEHASREGIAAMARAGTVAVLLPGAFYTLRETRLPPVDELRAHRVPIAISTDCNPGTSPVTSLLLMINMACTLFRLTPEEALAGVTSHAARALGLRDRGRLVAGARADLSCYEIAEPAELAYRVGANPCVGIVRRGHVIRWDA